jgi:HEAT repeat protein
VIHRFTARNFGTVFVSLLATAPVGLVASESVPATDSHCQHGAFTQTSRTSGDPALENLIQKTNDPDWEVRWEAVNTLGKLKDRRGVPALVRRAVCDPNPHPRWRSLWALRSVDSQGSDAVPLLRPALQDTDPVAVRNAAVALAFFGQPEARTELLKGLADEDAYRRWEAIFILRRIGSPEVTRTLIPLLDHELEPDEKVRREVTLTLGYMDSGEVIVPLLDVLQKDESPQVRWRAAMTLAKVGDAAIAPDLKQAMSIEEDPLVREHIEKALVKIKKY